MKGMADNPGVPVDAQGREAVDPTANVLQLVEAAIQRQDDLREAESKHIREIVGLRAEERISESRHITDTATLRATHENQLREAEAKRIDAIRAVDVGAVAAAAAVQATQATTLAAQVQTSAEALRNQVAAAATAQTVGLAAALEPIIKDIADLRRVQYESVGQKAQVVESRAGTGAVAGYIVGGIGALVAVASLLIVLLSNPPA